jgi:hypothetical protein
VKIALSWQLKNEVSRASVTVKDFVGFTGDIFVIETVFPSGETVTVPVDEVVVGRNLKLELVWVLSSLEGELGTEVFPQIVLFLEGFQDGLVESLLIRNSSCINLLLSFLLLGEDLLRFGLLLLLFGSLEVSIGELGVHFQVLELNNGGGSNHVSLVDSSKRNSVDLVWTCDEKKPRRKLLNENDSLSSESSSQNNQNGSRFDGLSKTCWSMVVFSGAKRFLNILSWVDSGGSGHNCSCFSFLSKLFCHNRGLLCGLGDWFLVLDRP